ncbi:hypothetical protein SDC9_85346 [bioreactor metagenome]|uniref:Uncharacterized protein n=1 Tax=bioreactor metagenome TaxID=1076179 RepID=A0A644ZCX5_9ZZZZ
MRVINGIIFFGGYLIIAGRYGVHGLSTQHCRKRNFAGARAVSGAHGAHTRCGTGSLALVHTAGEWGTQVW